MKPKLLFKPVLFALIVMFLDACAFIPKTVPETTKNKTSCTTVSSDWDIEVVPLGINNYYYHNEGYVAVILAVPIVTAAITLPIVMIGDSIHFIERQIRCN